MKRYKELERLVIEWADDKGILEKGNTKARFASISYCH